MSNPLSINLNKYGGYTNASKFVFSTIYNTLSDLKFIKWNLGDGTIFYNQREVEHYYELPGEYNITLVGQTNSTFLSAVSTITVENFLKESVYFDFIPPPTFAGHYNRYPFRIKITSSTTDNHYVDLYAQFSRSYPYQEPQNKWSFLRPQWRFLDLSGNQIWNIKTTDYPIKITENNAISATGLTVGVTGFADFYFIDDIYNYDLALSGAPYTTIWATLQTSAIRVKSDGFNTDLTMPSYANSTSIAMAPYVVLRRTPELLDIRENGIKNYSNPRWTDAKQPILIKAGFADGYPDEWVDGIGIREYDKDANFARYIPLEAPNIPLSAGVLGLSGVEFFDKPEFQWIDDTTYKAAGYYKGNFTTTQPYAFGAYVTAYANIPTPATSGSFYNPLIWLSNPQAGTFSIAQYYYNNTSIFQQISTPNLNKAQVKTFNMPIIQNVDFDMDAMALSGFHGIYSIAALPAPQYHAWMSDSELDKLYRINSLGQILCSIDLKSIVEENNLGFLINKKVSPAQIALDGNRNILVTLYDTVSVLKFDQVGNFLYAINPFQVMTYDTPYSELRWFLESSYYDSSTSGDYDYNLIEPTGIDTDKDNNIWVSYSNSLSGFVLKYNSTGNVVYSLAAPLCSTPQEIVTDKDGNVWICYSGLNWNTLGKIEKRSSNGTLLRAITGLRNPNYLTLDTDQNLWFSFAFHNVGTINTRTGTFFQYTVIGQDLKPNDFPKKNRPFDSKESTEPWFDVLQNADETAIEGIACDMRGYLYIINSIENQVYVFNTKTRKVIDRFYVNPQGFLFYQHDQREPTIMAYYLWNKSLQAAGDWTGWRWTNKYGVNYLPYYTNTARNFYTSGISLPLDFYDRSVYTAFKINEDFNFSEKMYNVANMPILQESTNFFQNFLGSIFGKEPFYHDDLGVTAYEKIANFVTNQADVDTCEISQLYSLSEMVDLDSDDFQLNYPPSIKRVMNLASVNLSKLIGVKCGCGVSFNKPNDCAKAAICSYCKKEKLNNRGDILSSLTYQVSAGTPVVMKVKSIDTYRLIPTGFVNGVSAYSLNSLATSIGLTTNWQDYYEFYSYLNVTNNSIIENLIDWSSDQTTISRNLSTFNDWYKQEGILDMFFNYELYNGLGLLDQND